MRDHTPPAPTRTPRPAPAGWLAPAVLAALVALPAPAAEAPAAQSEGIDVSHYSGAVDWEQVKAAGYTFAYVKATEGIDNPDASFADHWRRLAEVGLHRGAYHFYVTEDDPEEQARFFLSVAKPGPGDLAPVVDIELIGHGTQPGVAERLRTFLEVLERETGVRPIVYTSPRFWNANLTAAFGGYPLWLAEYGVDTPSLPEGWERWTLWQWQGDAPVPGVEKGADLSRLHTEVELEALRIPESP